MLLEWDADTNLQCDYVKMTALHWAAYNNDYKVVELLLQCGAKSLLNKDNNAPVDIAALCENWEVV